MAKSWEYSQWRRTVLQIVMWIVFAASVGVAQLVSMYRLHEWAVDFGPATKFGPVMVQLPAGWAVHHNPNRSNFQVIQCVEPNQDVERGHSPRAIEFFCEKLKANITPQQYLARRQGLSVQSNSDEDEDNSDDEASPQWQPITLAGQSGVQCAVVARPVIGPWKFAPRLELYACAMMPDGSAVTVKMECDSTPQPTDLALFQQVVNRVSLAAK